MRKLVEMLSTIGQFEELAKNKHIDGMDLLMKKFFKIVDEFKRKPYDLLDYQQNQFDRDFLEFNAMVHDVETSLQDFIDKSFENITSTEAALRLLTQFQEIMHREALKEDLDAKYMVIFRQLRRRSRGGAEDLREAEAQSATATQRAARGGRYHVGATTAASHRGADAHFAKNEIMMSRPESKRIVKMYNRSRAPRCDVRDAVAPGVDARNRAQQSGSARHAHRQTSGDEGALVNFDKDIMQLIRESKYMLRLDVEVPDLGEAGARAGGQVQAILQPADAPNRRVRARHWRDRAHHPELLKTAPRGLELTMLPGLTLLTWTSTNIDLFLRSVHSARCPTSRSSCAR